MWRQRALGALAQELKGVIRAFQVRVKGDVYPWINSPFSRSVLSKDIPFDHVERGAHGAGL